MATIYSHPKEIKVPSLSFNKVGEYQEECKRFKEELKNFLLKRNPIGKNVGEVIQFPVADSYAEYMVASMKPLSLVHIPLGDAWSFEYAHRLTTKDVQDKINQAKALAKLFAKK